MRQGRLFFTTDGAEAVARADAVFIAVGTPSRRGDGYADLTYVYAAAEEIARQVSGFTVVVTKSTVPVGTGDEIEAILRRVNPGADVAVVSNPEFLREGSRDRRFQAARPRGGGPRGRTRPSGDDRTLPTAQSERDADDDHRAGARRS